MKKSCDDAKCPFHGKLKIRGRTFTGKVISSAMRRTVTIELERLFFITKYQRYEKRRTRIRCHNPDCVNAVDGDTVVTRECRPLSKTKRFVVVEKVGKTDAST